MVEAKFYGKILILRCGNGGKYISNDFKNFCAEKIMY